jgi:hypothetical protein
MKILTNYTLLLRKEPTLLLNKYKIIALLFILFTFTSCERERDTPQPDLNDPQALNSKIKSDTGENIVVALWGEFRSDTLQDAAAGVEVENNDLWGIQFLLLEQSGNDFNIIYRTPILDGSFSGAQTEKIKFTASNYEMLYYNSSDYFLGSGGGEVFSYILDFDKREIYYSHLVSEKDKPISLFVSSNTVQPEIRNFFIAKFRRDFPDLEIVSEDINVKF